MKLGSHASSLKKRQCAAESLIIIILLCASCPQGVRSADISVTVNPSSGVDSSSCNMTSPCKTVAYAIQSRKANNLSLSPGMFDESSVVIDGSVPVLSISGVRGETVFDCSHNHSSGPAFTVTNTSIIFSGITFQNCANFNAFSSIGGALSASESIVHVRDCSFFNNTAMTGGAIGVASSSLAVSSCLFQNNTATCPNAASTNTACSAWGGAIGTVDAQSVSLMSNTFNNNVVDLVLNRVANAASQAVGGGGCISVLYNSNVSQSCVKIDGNLLYRCSVLMFGFNDGQTTQGIQFGNTYGGAVSLYYGLGSYSSLNVEKVNSSFTNNQCHSCSITSSVGISGNVYGGCLSIYTGPINVGTQGDSRIGSLSVSRMFSDISDNSILNCNASMSRSVFYSGNIYGGGISLVVGAYSYSFSNSESSSSSIYGSTTVFDSNYTIRRNTIISCSASSAGSGVGNAYGANVYGGGMLLFVGAYSYSLGNGGSGSSSVSGSTSVSNTSYTITCNTIANCSAMTVTSGGNSNGLNIYGGGMSLVVGPYSYSFGGKESTDSLVSGSTSVIGTNYTITNNVITSCRASTATSGNGGSFGANAYGGGLSLVVGPYSYSFGGSGRGTSTIVSGSTEVSESSYTIISNTLTSCQASVESTVGGSSGANVYGGGISLVMGPYSYNLGGNERSRSVVSGSTVVGDTIYFISSNMITSCDATSLTSGSIGSFGANVYGGGLSLVVGPYSYSFGGSGSITSSLISSSTAVMQTSCTITNNTLTSCSSSSVLLSTSGTSGSYGANVYGGCMLLFVGPCSYNLGNSAMGSSSSVSGSTAIISTAYNITTNTLVSCMASSVETGFGSTFGTNVYGGGLSLASGGYSYCYSNGFSSSAISSKVSGSTTVNAVGYFISKNEFTNCSSLSLISGGGSSNGANVYGGGLSFDVGPYSYNNGNSASSSISSVSASASIGNTLCTILSNTITNCIASSTASLGSSSFGANVYGGGISLAVGAFSYAYSFYFGSSSSSDVSGNTTVNNSSFPISSNAFVNCSASSVTSEGGSSAGADAHGGGLSVFVGPYCYIFGNRANGFHGCRVSGITTVINTRHIIVSNYFNICNALSQNSAESNGASSFGGAISVVFEVETFPSEHSSAFKIANSSSSIRIINSSFNNCDAITSSASCASASSNSAGGAVFSLLPFVAVEVFSSFFSNSSAMVRCAAFSFSTYSLGGGLSVMKADSVKVHLTNFSSCFAHGVPQATNVAVSGGGLHVQDSSSLIIENCFIYECGIRSAFSSFLLSGGGALGTKNVLSVHILRSNIFDNVDSSSTGIIFLQKLKDGYVMNVVIDQSNLSTLPSSTPLLNVSCGLNCSISEQKLVNIVFHKSKMSAISMSNEKFVSSAIASLPMFGILYSENSFFDCNFAVFDHVAFMAALTDQSAILLSCKPCPSSFEIASTSSDLDARNLQKIINLGDQQCKSLASSSAQQCPYGVAFCSTIVDMTVGYWSNFSTDGLMLNPSLCPPSYCGCRNIPGYTDPTCQLFPPLSPSFLPDDALCNGNRSGILCGGCKKNFTQSLNGRSCISNDVCISNLSWVWTLSIIGYIIYSVYIVMTATNDDDGFISCVLFFGQMSSFSSIPSVGDDLVQQSIVSSWVSRFTQFSSIVSFYKNSCYGPNMGAYAATVAQLSGPAIVFVFSLLMTGFINFYDSLQNQKLHTRHSFAATITTLLLLLFSSVCDVVFQLITCQDVGYDSKVVFIDGTVQCSGAQYTGLVVLAALLCMVPILFWAGVKFKKISDEARGVACSPFVGSRYYWSSISLIFRFVMTITYVTIREFPILTAAVMSFLTVCMLMLLLILRPYVHLRTHYMDVFCYACLNIQFLLECVVRASESLGVFVGPFNKFFATVQTAAAASNILSHIPFAICALVILPSVARQIRSISVAICTWLWQHVLQIIHFTRSKCSSLLSNSGNADSLHDLLVESP